MTIPKEIIKKIYKSLPDELSQIAGTPETSEINSDIARMYSLNNEQRLELGDEVTMRLLGITRASDFVNNLKNRLKIIPETAHKIDAEINTKILSKVSREILSNQENATQQTIGGLREEVISTKEVGKSEVPEVIHHSLPMVEEGEKVHDVPPMKTEVKPEVKVEAKVEERKVEFNKPEPAIVKAPEPAKPQATQPQTPPITHYEKGKDPYREPLV